MKKLIVILVFIASISIDAKSANNLPAWAWKHKFNAYINVIEYHNNFIYTAGIFRDSAFVFGNANIVNHGASDVVLMKWDTLGNMIWARSVWGSQYDTVVSIKVNSSDELIVAGNTNSSSINVQGNILTSNGNYDIFILKYDLNGNNLDAHIYGGGMSDFASDMCLDYLDNIYLTQNSSVVKYSPLGNFIWQQNIPANEIDYSKIDSTIVVSGYFTNTLTVGNFSITALYVPNWGVSADVFAAKISLNNSVNWLANVSNNYTPDYQMKAYIHEQTGTIFIGSTHFNYGGGDESFSLAPVSISGIVLNKLVTYSSMTQRCESMSGKDSLISFCVTGEGGGLITNFIYNIYTAQLIKKYTNVGKGPGVFIGDISSFQCFRGLQSLYSVSSNTVSFGKIYRELLSGSPSNQNITRCLGTGATIIGNIGGGEGNLNYSWSPATGLNNTNTDTVSFVASNNISYTLTVTDSVGQIAKDTFNIIIDTVLIPQMTTSQYPLFCADSMLLFSNMGIPVQWKIKPLLQNFWQVLNPISIDRMIYVPSKYLYQATNSCGTVSDSIEILPALIVTASTTNYNICPGQSVTLSGNGAVSYTWSNGITNNIAFTPAATQTYTVIGVDANGCKNTSTITIVVKPLPRIDNIHATPPIICGIGNAILGFNTINGLDTITWLPYTFLNTNLGNNVQATNINTTTTYTVTINGTNGCTNTDSVTVPVYAAINTSITPNVDTTICFGSNYILTSDSSFPFYQWTLYANTISNSNFITVSATGSYILSCTDSNGCTASDTVNILLLTNPHPILTYENYYLKCSNNQKMDFYWLLDGVPIAEKNDSLYVASEGLYKVLVQDENGCMGIDSFQMDIKMLTNNSADIALFPNPTVGDITMNYVLPDSSDVSIILYDINGRIVHSFLNDDFQAKGFHRLFFNLDLLGIGTGIYFFRVKLGINSFIKKMVYY